MGCRNAGSCCKVEMLSMRGGCEAEYLWSRCHRVGLTASIEAAVTSSAVIPAVVNPGWVLTDRQWYHAPSKHFLRCGWTLVGSLVSLRISSISSLDRKKNLGKAMRLTSR